MSAPAALSKDFRPDRLLRMARTTVGIWEAVGSKIYRRRPLPNRRDRMAISVIGREAVSADGEVISLLLALADRAYLPAWRPGAHIDVFLPSGRRRQYSLCGYPTDRRRYRIAVRRISAASGGRGGSQELQDLSVGAALQISYPRNAFPLALPGYGSSSKHLHFIAGGIGITPILPMARLADRLGVSWSLTYCGRSRSSLPFVDSLGLDPARVTVLTDDVQGMPTANDLLGTLPTRASVYCCGPEAMLRAIRDQLAHRYDMEVHFERFAAPPVVGGKAFVLELADTGQSFIVPSDRTALDVLTDTYPDFPYSCQQGFCGTCKTRILSGHADHRDQYLTDADRASGCFIPCVSRALSDRLTLHLGSNLASP